MREFSFEKLIVWQKAHSFSIAIYRITQDFPHEERFSLTSQIRRSAISISSNIAEGTSRNSKKDKARFIEIAYGSLMENLNQLLISENLKYISKEDLRELRLQIEEIGRMLTALKKSYLQS